LKPDKVVYAGGLALLFQGYTISMLPVIGWERRVSLLRHVLPVPAMLQA